jgi:hypothetical protein
MEKFSPGANNAASGFMKIIAEVGTSFPNSCACAT